SERKIAEDALKMVLFSVDNTHDAFIWLSREGQIMRTNRATSTMLGYPQEALLTLRVSDIVADMSPEAWLSIWENIRQSKTLIFNSKLCRHNRTLFPVEISTSFLQGDHDEGDRIFASVRDITERVASEEEKRTLERMAFHRERLATIGTLAAGVAHEINNPNNAIHFNAVMLQDIWPDLERVLQKAMDEDGNFLLAGLPVSESMETLPRMFEGIRKSSERIQSIIGNLKHLSRQEQGPVSVSIDLKMVLRETVAILQGQISRHTNHFHMEYLEQPVLVLGNAQQLEQVFINLILNALQSLPKRNLAVGVSMSKSLIPNEIQVIITDEGIGIPKENLSKLTDPFFTTKAEQDGTGLGLSIASSIITNHGGRMTFFSQEKTGTTVTVTLPTIATQKRGDHP
ncbi:MAG TPA: PAS domain S-box protein, partial [Magnetococcales bacterium]|nr:PAS domain S-box protein [Magnetococcales bacterium]